MKIRSGFVLTLLSCACLLLLTSCDSTFFSSKAKKISELISEKIRITNDEIRDIDRGITNGNYTIQKLNILLIDLEAKRKEPLKLDFSNIEKGGISNPVYSEALYKLSDEFDRHFLEVFNKNGINLQVGLSKGPARIQSQSSFEIVSIDNLDFILSDFYYNNISSYRLTDYYYTNNQFRLPINEIKRSIGDVAYINKVERLISFLKNAREQINAQNAINEQQKKEKTEYLTLISGEHETLKQQGTDKLLITFVLPAFAVVTLLLFLIPKVYKDESTLDSIFDKGLLLQLITIFLLVVTILILGIGGRLSEDVLGTLLGGISVYVLQKGIQNATDQPTPK